MIVQSDSGSLLEQYVVIVVVVVAVACTNHGSEGGGPLYLHTVAAFGDDGIVFYSSISSSH